MQAGTLNDEDRQRVAGAQRMLADLTADERPLYTIAKSIGALGRNAQGIVLEWSNVETAGAVGFTGDARFRHLSDHPSGHRLLPLMSIYRRDGRDPTQHRAVDFLRAARGDHERMEAYQKLVYESLDIRDQVRVLIGEPGEGTMTCCLVFETPFGLDRRPDVARLQAAVPALRGAVAAYRALGMELRSIDQAARAIDAFDEPAWLCSERGHVLHRNEAARMTGASTPACVLAAARAPLSPPACTDAKRLLLTDMAVVLVLFRRSRIQPPAGPPASVEASFGGTLPPGLAQVAGMLVAGMSEAEIARSLGRPLATVRTYVARIYRRVGVHGRAELMHRAPAVERSA